MALPDQERVNQIRRSLADGGLDALLLLYPDDILMATGMLPASTHVAVVVDRDGRVSLLTPWWREAFVAEESWAYPIDCFDWCKRGCQVDPDRAVIEWLRTQRSRHGIEKVGVHLQVHHYGPNKMPSECLTYDRIRAALPSIFAVVEDAGDRINQLKAVKTSREIGKLKLAHQVVRAGAQAFYQLAEAGMREIDLATEVHCAVLRKAASMGIAYVFCEMPQITSGPERTLIADTLSNHPTARKLQQGDPVLLELGAHTEGYWADITRAVVVGEPTPLLRRTPPGRPGRPGGGNRQIMFRKRARESNSARLLGRPCERPDSIRESPIFWATAWVLPTTRTVPPWVPVSTGRCCRGR